MKTYETLVTALKQLKFYCILKVPFNNNHDNNREIVERFRRLKTLYSLTNQKYGAHTYTDRNKIFNQIIIH